MLLFVVEDGCSQNTNAYFLNKISYSDVVVEAELKPHLWLDAMEGLYINEYFDRIEWIDRSINSYNFKSSGSLPEFKDGMLFCRGGVPDYRMMVCNKNKAMDLSGGEFCIFAVYNPIVASEGTLIFKEFGNSSNDAFTIAPNGTTKIGPLGNHVSNFAPNTGLRLINIKRGTNGIDSYLNGGFIATEKQDNWNGNFSQDPNRTYLSLHATMYIAEIIVYKGHLSEEIRGEISDYLMLKWGVDSVLN